jgi:hypothetical protein
MGLITEVIGRRRGFYLQGVLKALPEMPGRHEAVGDGIAKCEHRQTFGDDKVNSIAQGTERSTEYQDQVLGSKYLKY